MHKPTNIQTHVCTCSWCVAVKVQQGDEPYGTPLLPPCFDVANLKIKIHISKHKRMFVYMFVCSFIRACMCVCVYLFVHAFICLYVHVFIRLFVRLLICTCIRLFMRLCVCACICVFVHLYKCVSVALCECTFAQMHNCTIARTHKCTHCQRSSTVMSTLLPSLCISSVRIGMMQYLVFCPARVTVLPGVYV